MARFSPQALTGSALLAVPEDQLDSTTDAGSEQSEIAAAKAQAVPSENPGVGILSKLVFFVVVGGIVMIFVRSRSSSGERSLA